MPNVDLDEPLQNRMTTFKEKAMELLELLEGSGPAVRRIKVGNLFSCKGWESFFLQNGVIFSLNICVAIFVQGLLDNLPAHLLADIVASVVKTSYDEKLDILNSLSLKERLLFLSIIKLELWQVI